MERAFPEGPARPDFRGENRIPGLVFVRGLERASVGGGHLRLEHPRVRFMCAALLQPVFLFQSKRYRRGKSQQGNQLKLSEPVFHQHTL